MAKRKDDTVVRADAIVNDPKSWVVAPELDTRNLDRFINEISATNSAIEMLNYKVRILFYLKKLREQG